MKKVAIVTDSTACMPVDLINRYSISVAPQVVIWGQETLRDGVEITPEQFYERLAKASVMPSTSQASPATFEHIFRGLLDQGYDVLAIVLSHKLSGTYQSTVLAKETIGSDRIAIVDTLSTSMSMGFVVLEAAKAAETGASLEECAAVAEAAKARTGLVVAVDTLEFLHRGGRIGGAQRLMGTLLGLKPILELKDGRIEPLEKVRTRSKAHARMVEIVAERVGKKPVYLAVIHAVSLENAEVVLEMCRGKLNVIESYVAPVSPAIGANIGPGVVGITFMTAS
jgi:DegV family protein with EDD domain